MRTLLYPPQSRASERRIEVRNLNFENNYVIFFEINWNMLMTGGAIQVSVPKMFERNN